ncbi:MAG: endonuclease/exonuclease/phosphatase family protein [Planctomycetota bacterium]
MTDSDPEPMGSFTWKAAILGALVFAAMPCGCTRREDEEKPPLPMPIELSMDGEPSMVLDGQWDDWTSIESVVSDPAGDTNSVFDLTDVAVTMRGALLHLRMQFAGAVGLQSGAEEDGSLVLAIELSPTSRLSIDFRGRTATIEDGSRSGTVDWQTLRFAAQPTFMSDAYELTCDLSAVGVQPGDHLGLQFEDGDSMSRPLAMVVPPIADTDAVESSLDLAKPEGTMRVVSLNTLHQGTCDPVRGPLIRRTLQQLAADIVCFNEEWEEPLFIEGVANVLPDFGEDWQTVWSDGCAIATRAPMESLPFGLERGAVGLVHRSDQESLVVVSIHLPCCGHAGSEQEAERIAAIDVLIDRIRQMRQGQYGQAAKDAGVVVLGDFNLVGSPEPLTKLSGVGLTEVLPRSLIDGSAMTWSGVNPSDTFWPGRLDCITLDQQRLGVERTFLFDRATFALTNPDEDPSVASSDHAALVLDVSGRTGTSEASLP